jgi:hypothetical protein
MKKILFFALFLSAISSIAYGCMMLGSSASYSLCRYIALMGVPGILVAAGLSIALHGGGHGGGPLVELLAISTAINFLLYAGLCLAARSLGKFFLKRNGYSS